MGNFTCASALCITLYLKAKANSMSSILIIIKLVLLLSVALCCLWLFTHLGGLWLTNESQGYVFISKRPYFEAVSAQKLTFAGDEKGFAVYKAQIQEQYVSFLLEIRKTDSFKDIAIIRWTSVVLALLCACSFVRTLRTWRKKHKRYFKSQRIYEEKLRF